MSLKIFGTLLFLALTAISLAQDFPKVDYLNLQDFCLQQTIGCEMTQLVDETTGKGKKARIWMIQNDSLVFRGLAARVYRLVISTDSQSCQLHLIVKKSLSEVRRALLEPTFIEVQDPGRPDIVDFMSIYADQKTCKPTSLLSGLCRDLGNGLVYMSIKEFRY